MKKICYITTVAITMESFIIESAKFLKAHGDFDISFICDDDGQIKNDIPNNMHFFPVPMKRGISVGGIGAFKGILKILKKEKFDLVQYCTPNASFYAAIASWITRIPVRLYCQWGIVYVGFAGRKRAFFKFIEKFVCRLSTWVEPDSQGNLMFSYSEGLYDEKKSSVVWNGSASGVNLEKFDISKKTIWRNEIRKKYNISDDATVFIFVGRVTKDKGINELLQATKTIVENNRNVYLLIVGEKEDSTLLNQEIVEWSIEEEKVIYCGYENDVQKYYSASDIYVLPSYREGFGSTVVEAEAMRLPVIVTDIPGPTDAMKKDVTGLVVQKGSVKELSEAMFYLLVNVETRKVMADSAYTFATSCFEQKALFKKILDDRERLLGDV